MIIINQGLGTLPRELAEGVAAALGSVAYLNPGPLVTTSDNLRLVAMPRHRNANMRGRLFGWSFFTFKSLSYVLSRSTKEPILLVSNPPFSPVIGLTAGYLRHRPYALLVYDVYPEALERVGGLDPDSCLSQLWRKFNRLAVRRAEAVITISAGMGKVVSQYGDDRRGKPVKIVPTWVDTQWIHPTAKTSNDFARLHQQTEKLTVLYSGNIGRVHDLSMLPTLAQQLQDYSKIHFLVIGDGAGREALVDTCNRLALKNITFLPFQDEALLPYSLATADVSIVALAEAGEGVSMPSKTYYAMAAGSAVLGISRNNSDLAQVIREHDCGVNIEPGNVDDAAVALINFLQHPEQLAACRRRARAAAETHYDRQVVLPQLLAILRSAFEQ